MITQYTLLVSGEAYEEVATNPRAGYEDLRGRVNRGVFPSQDTFAGNKSQISLSTCYSQL